MHLAISNPRVRVFRIELAAHGSASIGRDVRDYVLLATDRMGIRNIVYAIAQGAAVFGPDCDAVACHPAVALEIDTEVRHLIDEAHDVALDILTEYRAKLDALADELIEHETLDREEVERFFADVPKREPRTHEVRSAGLAVTRHQRPDPNETPARPPIGGPGLAPA